MKSWNIQDFIYNFMIPSAPNIILSKWTCLLTQTSPFMKVDCSALCAPAIAASIRNPGCRPPYSYRLARPISMILRVQARSSSWLLSGTFIVNGHVCWRRHHHLWKPDAPCCALPHLPPVFVIRAVALLTPTGLPVQYPWPCVCRHTPGHGCCPGLS